MELLPELRRKDVRWVTVKKPKSTETEEQITVVDFCRISGIPVVHIPNEGKRSPWRGAEEVRMGLATGFPDLFLPLARGKYHGLMIEMKVTGGRLSSDQRKWLVLLRDSGYATAVCYGAEEAINIITKYKKLEEKQ